MAPQFENWGESFWRAYSYASDAKARRADLAKWQKDLRDREAADKLLKEKVKTIEEQSVRKNELERGINEISAQTGEAQKALDQARSAGDLDDDSWLKESARLQEQSRVQINPLEREWANEVGRISTFMADQAMTLTREGGGNPYVSEAAGRLFETSNRLGVVLTSAAEDRLNRNEQMGAMLAEQQEMGAREGKQREGSMDLENLRHKNTLSEIDARESGAAATGGGKPAKEKTPLDRLEKVAKIRKSLIDGGMDPAEADKVIESTMAQETGQPARPAEPPAAVAPSVEKYNKASEAQAKLQDALQQINSEIQKTPGLAGVDKGSPDYQSAMGKGDKQAKEEERRQQLLEMKAKYESILEDVERKAASSRDEALDVGFEEFDKELQGALQGVLD
jgi:hypothetical protein